MRDRVPRFVILISAIALLSGCFQSSKTVVEKISSANAGNKPVMNGVFYALPRTVVRVKIPVEREDKVPAEYSKFAKCFLPDLADEAILTRSTSFSIGNPEFEERGVPDLEEVYMIRVKGGYFEEKSLTMALTEAGVLTSVDATSEDKSVDVALAILDTAVDVGTEIAGIRSAQRIARLRSEALPVFDTNVTAAIAVAGDINKGKDELALTLVQNKCYQKFEATYLLEKLAKAKYKKEVEDTLKTPLLQKKLEFRVDQRSAEEIDVSAATAEQDKIKAAIRRVEADKLREEIREDIKARWLPDSGPITSEVTGVKQDLNLLKREVKEFYSEAEEKYKEIQAREQQLAKLIEGVNLPNTESEALKLTMDRLNTEIGTLQKKYFLGFKRSDTWTGSFDLNPKDIKPAAKAEPEKLALFNFSANGGVCQLLEKQGNKLKGNFTIAKKCEEFKEEQQEVALQVARTEKQLANTISTKVAPDSGHKERGFYYRVPGVADVKVVLIDAAKKETEKANKLNVQIAQYGTTASLPAGTGGRKTKYVLSLFESSGAMKNFAMGSDALITKSQIDEVNNTVTAGLEAKAKRKQAELDAELEAKDELKRLKREREILEEKNKIEAEKKKLQGSAP